MFLFTIFKHKSELKRNFQFCLVFRHFTLKVLKSSTFVNALNFLMNPNIHQ